MDSEDSDTVDMIAKALVEKFGARAIDVALSQVAASTGDMREIWSAVVASVSIQ